MSSVYSRAHGQTHFPPELRDDRHGVLKRLITRLDLCNQSDVVDQMIKAGFDVTQSSISRDFRELGITKVGGVYRVVGNSLHSFQSTIKVMITESGDAGPHLYVIKTTSGAASAVAEAIDLEDIDGVVGTVAGDNTIFVATKNKAAQTRVIERLKTL